MEPKRKRASRLPRMVRWLRAKLKREPQFIDVIRKIVDESVNSEISDRDLFELSKPRLVGPWPPSSSTHQKKSISSDSVDVFFYPAVRNKLKKWQRDFFDKSLSKSDRYEAKDN